MNVRRSVFLMAGFSMAVLVGGHATPARADFTWMQSPPPAQQPQAATPQSMTNDVAPPMPAQKVAPIQATPLAPRSLTANAAAPSPVAAPMPAVSSSATPAAPPVDNVSGFATGVPLSLALSQLVPSRYDVILGHGVRGRTQVSWTGGKPWEQVLSDMLAPAHMSFSLSGHRLTVERNGAQAASLSAPISVAPQEKMPTDVMAPPAASPPVVLKSSPPVALTASTGSQSSATAQNLPTPLPPVAAPVMAAPQMSAPPQVAAAAPATAPQVASPAAPAAPWSAQKGQTLKAVLTAWAQAAHVHLYWAIDYNYRLPGDVSFDGNFTQAVSQLFDLFSQVHPQPYGQLHTDQQNGDVLIVRTYGDYN